MSSLAELEAAHASQGTKVAELKAVDKTSDAAKAAVQELLRIKREITALDPDHKFAIKKKEKKKKKSKARGPTKKELRILKKQEAARKKAEAEAAAAAGTNTGICPWSSRRRSLERTWTRVGKLTQALTGQKVLVRARLHNVRAGQGVFHHAAPEHLDGASCRYVGRCHRQGHDQVRRVNSRGECHRRWCRGEGCPGSNHGLHADYVELEVISCTL